MERIWVNVFTHRSCWSGDDTHVRVATADSIVDSSCSGRFLLYKRARSLRIGYFWYEVAIRWIRWIVLGEISRYCLLLISRNAIDIRESASGTVVDVIRVADWIEHRTLGLEN
jgi:hypothetical protein